MRVAILVSGFPPTNLGGAQIASYNIAKQLSKKGYNIHIVTTSDGTEAQEDKKNNFCIKRIKVTRIPVLRSLLYAIKSLIIIKKINPEIIHSQNSSFYSTGLASLLIKRILNLPLIVQEHGDIYLTHHELLFKKLVLSNSNVLMALTKDMRNYMGDISKNQTIHIIPNGCNINDFSIKYQNKLLKKPEKVNDEKLIVFAGRLHPIKGLQYLIKSMKVINQNYPNSKLLIFGKGEDRDNLEKLVEKLNLVDYIKFFGEVPNEKIPEYLGSSDVFVLPSMSEGFPVTVLEAMAAGLPIVCTNIRGLAEIVKEGENGYLVEPGNPEKIAEKVLLLLNDSELRMKISKKNKEEVKKYSWENITKKIEFVYSKTLTKTKKQERIHV